MARSAKPPSSADVFLESFEFFRIKLNDLPALDAQHMIMVFMPEGLLINRAVLAFPHPIDESAITQKAQRPVDGGTRCLQPCFLYLQIEGLGIEMPVER